MMRCAFSSLPPGAICFCRLNSLTSRSSRSQQRVGGGREPTPNT
jgi:hypothetical protein